MSCDDPADPHHFIELQFDFAKRRAAFAHIRERLVDRDHSDAASVKLVDDLEKGFDDAWFEGRFTDAFLEESGEMVHEIARSTPAPHGSSGRAAASMSRYWRWALWEDCIAYVPDQVARCLQALCAAQFDAGLREAESLWLCDSCRMPFLLRPGRVLTCHCENDE